MWFRSQIFGILMLQNSQSEFRNFVYHMWWKHQDEIYAWTGNLVQYDDKYYFRKHRWLLKKMFKEQQKNAN